MAQNKPAAAVNHVTGVARGLIYWVTLMKYTKTPRVFNQDILNHENYF